VGQIRRSEQKDPVTRLLQKFARLPPPVQKRLHDLHEYRSWYKWGYDNKEVWTNGDVALRYGAAAEAWAQFAAFTDSQAKVADKAIRHAAKTPEPYGSLMVTKKLLQILWSAAPVDEGGPPGGATSSPFKPF